MDIKAQITKTLLDKQEIVNKLNSPVPAKHTAHPATYKAFLNNELRIVNNKLEKLKGV